MPESQDQSLLLRCVACSYATRDASGLKRVECSKCKEKSNNFNYLCPRCGFPLLKITSKF